MSAEIVIAFTTNLQGKRIVLIQQGRSYLVADKALHHKECKHDQGFTLTKVESDLYGYACKLSCGFVCSFSPDDYPDGVAYVRHEPSPDDLVLPPINWKGGEH